MIRNTSLSFGFWNQAGKQIGLVALDTNVPQTVTDSVVCSPPHGLAGSLLTPHPAPQLLGHHKFLETFIWVKMQSNPFEDINLLFDWQPHPPTVQASITA